jgi:septum formation protein
MNLILASTSPYRRALLERLGYPFTCEKPNVDEDRYKADGHAPQALAALLAREKAREVSLRKPGALVIGGDQVAALGTSILGKPGSVDMAVAQLLRLQNQTHQLFTAVHLLGPGIDIPLMETTHLSMRALSFQEARLYVLKDQPLDCAGSYKLEVTGVKLFSKIEGADHDAIVGLPLISLQTALLGLGFRFFDETR